MHPGVNTITLQAAEESTQHVPDAGLTYDAIALNSSPNSFHAQKSSAQIVPTIFYTEQGRELQEIAEVFLRSAGPFRRSASMDLTISGRHYRQAIVGKEDFGEERLEFALPEFTAKTRAQLRWNVDGHPRSKKESIDPAKKWTLYMVPHIHLDVGYTDYQAKVAAIQSRVIDEALEITGKHPDFRFSLDGEWSLEQFLKTRTPAEQKLSLIHI